MSRAKKRKNDEMTEEELRKQREEELRKQLLKEKIKKLVEQVNSAQVEGEFDDVNMLPPNHALCRKYDEIKKFVDQDSFEILALFDELGAHTGYAKCTLMSCQAKMIDVGERVFICQDSERPGVKKQLVLRHFNRFHKTNIGMDAQHGEISSDSSQSTITQFMRSKGKRLPEKAVESLRKVFKLILAR